MTRRTQFVQMLTEKGRRTRAMATNSMTTRGRTATAVIAATLTVMLAVDPFGMSSLVTLSLIHI